MYSWERMSAEDAKEHVTRYCHNPVITDDIINVWFPNICKTNRDSDGTHVPCGVACSFVLSTLLCS